jgi:hypothetical protein
MEIRLLAFTRPSSWPSDSCYRQRAAARAASTESVGLRQIVLNDINWIDGVKDAMNGAGALCYSPSKKS